MDRCHGPAQLPVCATVVGQLQVQQEVTDLDCATAEKWATNIFNFVGKEHPELAWVIIEDATGTGAGQVQRSDRPLLN